MLINKDIIKNNVPEICFCEVYILFLSEIYDLVILELILISY